MADCVFCKILAGDIPSSKVLETETTVAFLDIFPKAKGHTLVIPKVHTELLMDLDENIARDLIVSVQRTAQAVMAATQADGCNILQNNRPASGQEVPHVHFHIVPRMNDDGLRFFPSEKTSYEEGELEVMRANIVGALR